MIHINPKTQALIFDCDGTIADTMLIHNEAWNIIAKRYQLNFHSSELERYNGIPTLQILKILTKNQQKKHFDFHKIVHEKESIAAQKINQINPIIPIVNLIRQYHKKLPMVVISGGTQKNVIKTLDALNLKHHFEFIITGNDSHPTKDSPESFILIADRLNVKCNQCHVFEDGKPGLINAIKANMMVTDVRTMYS